MKTNKFNIGQKVIVIEGGHVIQKTVKAITFDSYAGELRYELTGNRKKPDYFYEAHAHASEAFGVAFTRMGLDLSWPSHLRKSSIRAIDNRPSVVICDDIDHDGKYLESDLFTSEEDFRANVKIQMIEPTKTELIDELKKVPNSAFTSGSEHVRELIQKIHA